MSDGAFFLAAGVILGLASYLLGRQASSRGTEVLSTPDDDTCTDANCLACLRATAVNEFVFDALRIKDLALSKLYSQAFTFTHESSQQFAAACALEMASEKFDDMLMSHVVPFLHQPPSTAMLEFFKYLLGPTTPIVGEEGVSQAYHTVCEVTKIDETNKRFVKIMMPLSS